MLCYDQFISAFQVKLVNLVEHTSEFLEDFFIINTLKADPWNGLTWSLGISSKELLSNHDVCSWFPGTAPRAVSQYG